MLREDLYTMRDELIGNNPSCTSFDTLCIECAQMEELYGELIEEGGPEEEKKSIVKRMIDWLRKMFSDIRARIKKFFSKQSPEELQEEVEVDKVAWDNTLSFLTNVKNFLAMGVKKVINDMKAHKVTSIITLITGFAVTAILAKDHKVNKSRTLKKQDMADAIKKCDDLILKAEDEIASFANIYDTENKKANSKAPEGKKGLFGRVKPPSKAELDKYEAMRQVSGNRAKKAMDNINKTKEKIREYENQKKEFATASDAVPEANYNTFLMIYRTIVNLLNSLLGKLQEAIHSKGSSKGKKEVTEAATV